MNKQPDITEATRRRILDAFWTLFRKKPPEKITASALAAEANMHRSSFYRYFSDIYQVLDVFQAELLWHLKNEIDTIQTSTDITLPEYTEKISVLLTNSADKIYRLLNYKGCDFREQFVSTLKPNIERYLHSDMENPHTEYITAFILSAMLFNFNFWYEHRDHYALQQVTSLGKNIVLNGLSVNGFNRPMGTLDKTT